MPTPNIALRVRVVLLATMFVSNCGWVLADQGTLVAYVPKVVTPQQVKGIVQQAFVNRRWSIDSVGEATVTGRLIHRDYDCRVVVLLMGDSMRYEDQCTRTRIVHIGGESGSSKRKVEEKSSAPASWINNLREDVSQALNSIPDVAPVPAPGSTNAAERMKALKELLDSGLITQQEFDQKRQEILKSL